MSEPIDDQPKISEDVPKSRQLILRPRFGLKSFLAFVTLLGLFFGFIYPYVQRARTESAAVSDLKSLYATDYSKPEILYDYQVASDADVASVSTVEPPTPKWVRMILGEHCFSTVKQLRLVGGVNDKVKSFEDVVSHVAKFKNLDELDVDGLGHRKDTDFFVAYPDLRVLSLNSWKELEDLTGLTDLNKLESLDLSMTNVRSLAPVADCSKMKQLYLAGCESLVDIELIAGMQDLVILEQNFCSKVKSLEYLGGFEKLEHLGCGASDHVKSFDFALIAKNKNLKSLSLGGFESFENIELLNEFSNLNHLKLNFCRGFERLPSLKNLTKLTTIVLQNCDSLKSLQGIGDSGSLDSISLARCKNLTNIEAILGLNSVSALVVEDCDKIANYQPISDMKSLKRITLQGASIKNLDMLKGLELSDVTIWNCPNLIDIGGLAGLGEAALITIQNCIQVTEEMTFDIEDATGVFIRLF